MNKYQELERKNTISLPYICINCGNTFYFYIKRNWLIEKGTYYANCFCGKRYFLNYTVHKVGD